MDPSALIFIAVAVAWAVYLIPKALDHHHAERASRNIGTFSDNLRVVTTHDRKAERAARKAEHRAEVRAEHEAQRRPQPALTAEERRRRVLGTLAILLGLVAGAGLFGMISLNWIWVPGLLIVGWLALCRVSVMAEHAARKGRSVFDAEDADLYADEAAAEPSVRVPAASAPAADGATVAPATGWTPVQSPLPTYLVKEQVRAAHPELDFDSTGAWSSGHDADDAALAAWAEADRKATLAALAESRARNAG